MFESLANLLKKQKVITGINLEGNDITHIGVTMLAEALKDNQEIHTLSLKCNPIGDIGSKALASIINSTAIQTLDLSGCEIRTEGWTALCVNISDNETITELSLSNARLQGYELVHTCKMLLNTPSLRRLCLSRLGNAMNDENCVRLAEYLQNNDSLTFLDLSMCAIGTEGVNAFRQVLCKEEGGEGCALEHLILSYNRLSEHAAEDLAYIIQNSSLRALELRGCAFHDQGLTVLARATATKSKALMQLHLDGNWFGQESKKAWQQTMKNSTLDIDFKANISCEATEYNLEGEGFVADRYC